MFSVYVRLQKYFFRFFIIDSSFMYMDAMIR